VNPRDFGVSRSADINGFQATIKIKKRLYEQSISLSTGGFENKEIKESEMKFA
jgi:hypothetical protein